jgi:tripartite-type tricarboxylate transporter receptor subunit TctC
MSVIRTASCFLFAAAGAAAITGPAAAQSYPTKPITVVVTFSPGGINDYLARLLGQKVSEDIKQPILVDYKPGATGAIGLQYVARAPADGYTLVMVTASTIGTNPVVKKVPFDPIKDFAPIGRLAVEPLGVALHPSVPANTIQELVALAKSRPGALNMASFGTGSSSHLAGELFSLFAGINMTHIPYKGAGPATADLISGQVQVMFNSISVFVPPTKSGQLKMIASTGPKRTTQMPSLPTVAESGFPGFEVETWHGLLAPANTPPEVIGVLSKAFGRALQQPDVRAKLEERILEPLGATPDELATTLKRDIEKWKKVVKAANIEVE